MFQYAAGRALADRLGAELLLDTRAFGHTLAFRAYARREYALGQFKLRARVAAPAELEAWPKWVTDVGARLPPFRPLFRRWHFEPAFTYDPRVRRLEDPVCLVGYWQSERYFIDSADRIRADFILQAPLTGSNARFLEHAYSGNSVGLHVRRGDFVELKTAAQMHGLCSIDYYRRAIGLLRERSPGCRFLVFSDDLDWARAELPLDSSAVFVTGNAETPELDLILMSACSHQIIANSSFSWWGAWLGVSPSKIVVAPKRWFLNTSRDTSDLIPNNWIRM